MKENQVTYEKFNKDREPSLYDDAVDTIERWKLQYKVLEGMMEETQKRLDYWKGRCICAEKLINEYKVRL